MLTILTPAASVALTDLARVKADLAISGTADDTYLTAIIDDVSIAIASWCGRVFAREEVTETFRPAKRVDALPLSRWHNVDISAVTIDGESHDITDIEVDGSLLYKLDADGDRTQWERAKIVITYEAGYLLPEDDDRDLPLDIERACIAIVKADYFGRTRDPNMRSDATDGLGSIAWHVGGHRTGSGWSSDVEALLAPYRSVTLA
jgi:hypothetical protein